LEADEGEFQSEEHLERARDKLAREMVEAELPQGGAEQ